jgi:MtN3 and saliva related transmembrane protein
MIDNIQVLGYIAGFCSTVAFIPQVYRTYYTRQAYDISYGMLFLLMTGMSLWFIYGCMISAFPVIIANGCAMVLILILTGMKLFFS